MTRNTIKIELFFCSTNICTKSVQLGERLYRLINMDWPYFKHNIVALVLFLQIVKSIARSQKLVWTAVCFGIIYTSRANPYWSPCSVCLRVLFSCWTCHSTNESFRLSTHKLFLLRPHPLSECVLKRRKTY